MDKGMAIIIALIVSVFIFAVCWVFKPHLKVEYVRINSNPEVIRAQWVAWACGRHERITEIIDEAGNLADAPFTIHVASQGLNPELSKAAFLGNVFYLTGYRYQKLTINRITQSEAREHSSRLDVIKWHVRLPYRTLTPYNDVIDVNTPLFWGARNDDDSAQTAFVGLAGVGC